MRGHIILIHLIVTITFYQTTTFAAKLPKQWKTCSRSDPKMNDCLKVAALEAVIDLSKNGSPALGVLPLDPLRMNAITIDQGHGPVAVKLDFIDIDIIGFKEMKLTNLETDWKVMKVDLEVPVLMVVGNYKIDGKVLVLPISGEGRCNLTFNDFIGNGVLKFKEIQKDDKKYYQIVSMDFHMDAKDMKVQLDNLFNGDKALGDNMNLFLNENWKEILGELRPAVSKAFGAAYKDIGNRIFSKVPLEQISPP